MKWIFLFVLIFPLATLSQKEITLKRKYFGKYEGTVPAYSIGTSLEIVDVDEVEIMVTIGKDFIYTTIGARKLQGTYTIMFEAEDYFLLDASMTGQLANERILVYKQGKKIAREGMYPQPLADLKKIKN